MPVTLLETLPATNIQMKHVCGSAIMRYENDRGGTGGAELAIGEVFDAISFLAQSLQLFPSHISPSFGNIRNN